MKLYPANISFRFYENSEVSASEFEENMNEMFAICIYIM